MSEYLYKGVSSVTGDWITGSLYVVELDRMFIMDPKGCAQVRPETVCQCTDLTDRNGRKIFRNDICRIVDEDGTADYRIRWNVKNQCCEAEELSTGYTDTFDRFFADRCEVVGNVHDQEVKHE